MSFKIKGKSFVFKQSAIDPSVWVIVRGDIAPGIASEGAGSGSTSEGVGRALHSNFDPQVAESGVYSYLATYVNDVLILGPDPIIDNVKGEVEAK